MKTVARSLWRLADRMNALNARLEARNAALDRKIQQERIDERIWEERIR